MVLQAVASSLLSVFLMPPPLPSRLRQECSRTKIQGEKTNNYSLSCLTCLKYFLFQYEQAKGVQLVGAPCDEELVVADVNSAAQQVIIIIQLLKNKKKFINLLSLSFIKRERL